MLNLTDITVRLGGRTILDSASAKLPPKSRDRADRPQRRRQVDSDEGDRSASSIPTTAASRCRAARASAISRRKRRAATRRRSRPCSPPIPSARALLAESETSQDPDRSASPRAADGDRRLHRAERARRASSSASASTRRCSTAARQLLGRLEDARGAGVLALLRARHAAARRAFEPSRSRSDAVARNFLKSYPATILVVSHERDCSTMSSITSSISIAAR
jgi:ATP-binding cassette subfamily F protein 3